MVVVVYPDGRSVCMRDALDGIHEARQQIVETVCGVDAPDHIVEYLERVSIEVCFAEGGRCRITSYNVCYTKLLRRRCRGSRLGVFHRR